MTRSAGQPAQNDSTAPAVAELHLCNNLRHLVFALTDIAGRGARAHVVYLEDHAPLSAAFKARLSQTYPQIETQYSTDAAQIAEFAGVQNAGLIRRNIRLGGPAGVTRATRRPLPLLGGRRFDVGYLYHSGLFTAKSAAFSCDHVVLRESGLNNYVSLCVPWPKALVRACAGLPPFAQVWGEERWVDVIEAARPDALPVAVRAKSRALKFSDLFVRLDPAQARALGQVFVPDPPVLGPARAPRAVVLTQPLEAVGLCSGPQKHALYQQIVTLLGQRGFEVHVKHHPSETPYPLQGATRFEVNFPVELWRAIGLPRFDLGVALCSASLSEGDSLVAGRVVQLVTPAQFNPAGMAQWRAALPAGLAVLTG